MPGGFSGKSTLLNILGGLDTPTEGRVFYRSRELTRASEAELTSFRRHHIGFVFQFYNLIPSLTARENVALVTDIATAPFEPEEVLDLVGLGDRLDHFPASWSGRDPTASSASGPSGAGDRREHCRIGGVGIGQGTIVVDGDGTVIARHDRMCAPASGRRE
ncbi:hypothetical protein BH24GEM1_BH24GEM1_12710 [soil metagenome]